VAAISLFSDSAADCRINTQLLQTDALALLSTGASSVVALMGANQPWRPEYTAQIKGASKIVICGDNDHAGQRMNLHVASALVEGGVPEDKVALIDWARIGRTLNV
jgi:hypothetical protein